MSYHSQKEEKGASARQADTQLDKRIVTETLSDRINRDIKDALNHLEFHEVIGLLDMIKTALTMEVFKQADRQEEVIRGNA